MKDGGTVGSAVLDYYRLLVVAVNVFHQNLHFKWPQNRCSPTVKVFQPVLVQCELSPSASPRTGELKIQEFSVNKNLDNNF